MAAREKVFRGVLGPRFGEIARFDLDGVLWVVGHGASEGRWHNVKLVAPEGARHKASYWLGVAKDKLASGMVWFAWCNDLALLHAHRPEVKAALSDALLAWQHGGAPLA